MYFSHKLSSKGLVRHCLIASVLLCLLTEASAEGTANLRGADGDPVMLFVGHPDFGNFAAYDSPASSRLNFRVATAGEMVYIGMARAYRSTGLPSNNGRFSYRVRSSATGAVVFGPVTVDAISENLTSYAQAVLGPAELTTGGYPTNANSSFAAPAAGEYYLEFDQTNDRPRYIGLWDITIANNGVRQPGRVYSRNWAFRVPELEPELPECAFGAELSTKFYSYTSDGFVTEIDFTDSGFQPLSFTLAFNRRGPGQTGDLQEDRRSIPEANATDNVAEHLIFLEQPDAELFPDGICGDVTVSGTLTCQANDTYCIPVTATQEGQVEITLDFNGNGVFDEATDRLILYQFTQQRGFDACVPWDGLLADGTRPPDGQSVDLIVNYIQGIQHWALYDGELMRNGFCVSPVRPICGDANSVPLFYDDTNIPDDPGNGAPKRVLDGCECQTPGCRTWTNFEANATDNCSVDNDQTTGYGDRNTLNTWWYAASQSTTSFEVPISAVTVSGPEDHCPGDAVELKVDYDLTNAIASIRWEGPSGPLPAGNDREQLAVTESGRYTVTITDEFGCESSGFYVLADVSCSLNLTMVSVTCEDNGTETDGGDDLYRAVVRVEGNNSSEFILDGQRYTYGSEVAVGPFRIADGDVTIAAADALYGCCNEQISIMAPAPCSDGCAITSGIVLDTECDNLGTTIDPSDDQFTFEMEISGINVGSGWVSESGQTGTYGTPATFGPFDIAAGTVNLDFTDADDPDCVFTAVVQPPMSCSFDCELDVNVANVLCDDQGTPFDVTDDTYTYDLTVTGVNTASPAYQVNGAGAYLYGQTVSIGPFAQFGASFEVTITDMARANCTTTYRFTQAELPRGCEVPCSLEMVESRVVCEDFGTSDPSDDEYAVEVMISSRNPSARSWIGPDGQEGAYGSFVRVGRVFPNGQDFTLTVTDADDADCSLTMTVAAPRVDIDCPDDQETARREVTSFSFGSVLNEASDREAGTTPVCWMADETTAAGDRYADRLQLQRPADAPLALESFSFYLFGPEGAELRGAIFEAADQEVLDCCNLTNDGPVTSTPTNPFSMPGLPDSLAPAGMVLQQRFSVALRPAERYSLVTSSRSVATTGDYRWVVLSTSGELLTVAKADAPDPEVVVNLVFAEFPLLNAEIAGLRDAPASLAFFGQPTIDSLCGTFDLTFSDNLDGTCALATLSRSFGMQLGDTTLTDICVQQLTFRGAGINNINWPPVQFRFGCVDTFPLDVNGHPGPDLTGFPWIYLNGERFALDSVEVDGLVTDYTDIATIRETDGGTTILRTWRVQDPCREQTHFFEQTIKLENNGVPFFECPVSNHYCPIVEEDIMLWNTRPFDCVADIDVPRPVLNNICDSLGWTFTTDLLRLEENGDTSLYATLAQDDDRRLIGVPPGDYFIRYRGEHERETIPEQLCRIRVADLTDPVAVCRTNINLSLPGSGVIALRVRGADLGSYDNCAVDSLLIRRRLLDSLAFGPWDDRFVAFDCADVGFRHEVQLLAVDEAGNRNYCTTFVTVRDNTDPYCTGLNPVFTNCDSLPNNFYAYDTMQLRALYGMPDVIDNCSARALELEPIVTGDECMPNRIRRRFRALDQHGNFSTGLYFQDINIAPSLGYAIQLPMDADTDCTDFTDTIVVIGAGCDSITYRYVDVLLPTEGEECRYVQRNFVVTNWCEWDGVSDAIQIGRDENCDGSEGEAPVWLVRTEAGIFIDVDSVITNNLPAAGTVCDAGNPAGYLREVSGQAGGRYAYSQRFRVFDVTAPEVTISGLDSICVDTNSCRTDVVVGIELFDACQIDEGNILVAVDLNNNGTAEITSRTAGELTGIFPNYEYTINLPLGDHRMIFTVTDDCGNTTVLERAASVYDCYVPVLTCREDRLYNLEALTEEGDVDMDGVVEEAAALVEATDIASCAFADCNGDLIFSLNRVGEPVDAEQSSLFLDCDDRYEVFLEVYVWDRAFNPFAVQPDSTVGGPNWRSCVVRVRLQDPTLACNDCQVGDNLTVNGRITGLGGAPLEEVTVIASDASTVTNRFGGYQLSGRVGDSFVVSAEREDDPRAGLSTLDLLILRRQLLGLEDFATPFQRLAADLNGDGETNVMDALMLQGVILGYREFYPASAWRFVAADWDGTGVPSEEIVLSELAACSFDHDFIGLRLGDLNDSYGAGAGAGNGRNKQAGPSGRPTGLTAADAEYLAGEEVVLRVQKTEADRYAGGQFALSWGADRLTFLGVAAESAVSAQQVRASGSGVWVSWSEALDAEESVALRFRAETDLRLSEVVELAEDSRLPAEAYDTDLGVHPLSLEWTAPNAPDTEPLVPIAPAAEELSVTPNPARTLTRVGFTLAEAQRVRLEVIDLRGRRVLDSEQELAAGEQWLQIDVADWAPGVYQVRVFTQAGVIGGRIMRQ